MSGRNEQLGTVACPFPGCAVVCRLFKYRPREDGRRSAFTGKWYAECTDHGRIDGSSGKSTQEYLCERAEVWGAKKPEGTQPEKPVIQPEKPESKPVATVAAPAPKPAQRPATKPDQQQKQPEPKTGWGFF